MKKGRKSEAEEGRWAHYAEDIESGALKFPCHQCQIVFPSPHNLARHVCQAHGGPDPDVGVYRCLICGKTFDYGVAQVWQHSIWAHKGREPSYREVGPYKGTPPKDQSWPRFNDGFGQPPID